MKYILVVKKVIIFYIIVLAFQDCSYKSDFGIIELPIKGKMIDSRFFTSDSAFIIVDISSKKDSIGTSFNDLYYFEIKDTSPKLKFEHFSKNISVKSFRNNYFIFSERYNYMNLVATDSMKIIWSMNYDICKGLSDNYLYGYRDDNNFYVANILNPKIILWEQEAFGLIGVNKKQEKILGKSNDELQLRDINNGSTLWSFNLNELGLKKYPNCYVSDNLILITDVDKLLCLDIESGDILWENSFNVKPVHTGIDVWSKNYSNTDLVYFQTALNLYFIDLQENKVEFVCEIKRESLQQPIVVKEYVYFVDDKKVYRYRHNEFQNKELVFENENTFECCIVKSGYVYQLRDGKSYYKAYPE